MSDSEPKSIRKAYHEELSILVVEDYMVFSKEVRHALPEHKMIFASNIEDATRRYEENWPNIVFLDLDLPDGDGFELLDFIRARDPSAFVVIISGSKIESDIEKARLKGAQGYIFKPFTRALIKQHIDTYVEQREKDMKTLVSETSKRRQLATPAS